MFSNTKNICTFSLALSVLSIAQHQVIHISFHELKLGPTGHTYRMASNTFGISYSLVASQLIMTHMVGMPITVCVYLCVYVCVCVCTRSHFSTYVCSWQGSSLDYAAGLECLIDVASVGHFEGLALLQDSTWPIPLFIYQHLF